MCRLGLSALTAEVLECLTPPQWGLATLPAHIPEISDQMSCPPAANITHLEANHVDTQVELSTEQQQQQQQPLLTYSQHGPIARTRATTQAAFVTLSRSLYHASRSVCLSVYLSVLLCLPVCLFRLLLGEVEEC